VWLFIHIAFLTGFRNRVSALLTWWVAFVRDIRKERAYTTRAVGTVRDVYEPALGTPSPRTGEQSTEAEGEGAPPKPPEPRQASQQPTTRQHRS